MAAPHVTGTIALWIAHNSRPITGNANYSAVKTIIIESSEVVGLFKGDPDGVAEPMINANTSFVGGSGENGCCPAK